MLFFFYKYFNKEKKNFNTVKGVFIDIMINEKFMVLKKKKKFFFSELFFIFICLWSIIKRKIYIYIFFLIIFLFKNLWIYILYIKEIVYRDISIKN
jgi:hypothetical protein